MAPPGAHPYHNSATTPGGYTKGMRYREMLTVAVALNRQDDRALHVQLADQISTAIDAGTLAADTRMPFV
jgi:hypothetical protein